MSGQEVTKLMQLGWAADSLALMLCSCLCLSWRQVLVNLQHSVEEDEGRRIEELRPVAVVVPLEQDQVLVARICLVQLL